MNYLNIYIALSVGVAIGFAFCAILSIGKRADEAEDLGPETHCDGDGTRFVHLLAKRYNISRVGETVALIDSDTGMVVRVGRDLRSLLDGSMGVEPAEAADAGHR